MTHLPDGPWYYQMIELGYNYRISDLQAALGLSQLSRLDEFIAKRNTLVARYNELIDNNVFTLPWQHPDTSSSHHLYIVRLKKEGTKVSHKQVFESLRAAGILVNLHYIPVYRQPYYQQFGYKWSDFPESEAYYSEAISLPLYPDLSEEQQLEVVNRLMSPIGHQNLF
jgi:dTDP-4-amino-4,6-dideoxygalactose transaminase